MRFILLLSTIFCLAPVLVRAGDDVIRVGLTGKYPPFNTHDGSGKLVGFDVDVAKYVCAELKKRCEFVILQWDGIVSALLAGRIDAIIGSMAVTPERAKQVRFSAAYYESGAQLFLRGREIDPAAEGVRLGVTLGTTYGRFARERYPRADIRTYKGDVEALQDIRAGRLDGMVTDRLVGLHMNERMDAGLVLAGDLLYEERIAIPTHPAREDLARAIDGAVRKLRGSPEYERLLRRYFGGQASARTEFSWPRTIALMLRALGTTVRVSLSGLALGMAAAALVAFLLVASPRMIAGPVALGVDLIRATPFLVQLFVLYFGLPAVGLRLSPWAAAVGAIGVHSSAYLAEILKMAYQSVPSGQRQAAHVLGLTGWETLRHVVWPQMVPLISAPSLNTMVAMIKDSAIVSVISVHELTLQAQQLISASFRPMELYLLAAIFYAGVTYPMLLAGRRLERRFRKRGLLHA